MSRKNSCLVETAETTNIKAHTMQYITVSSRINLVGTLLFTPLENTAFFDSNHGISSFGTILTSNIDDSYSVPIVNDSNVNIHVKKSSVLGVFEVSDEEFNLITVPHAHFDLKNTKSVNNIEKLHAVDNLTIRSKQNNSDKFKTNSRTRNFSKQDVRPL